jgi:RND family efflux transporter MFP subunit
VVKPAAVRVAHPVVTDITDYEDITGRTESTSAVDLKARVTGYLKEDYLRDKTEGKYSSSKNGTKNGTREGKMVEKGQLLFVIDPEQYLAEKRRTEAIVLQNEARLKRLTKDYGRAVQLYEQKSMSQEQFDQISGDYLEAQESLKMAKASDKLAGINVGYTEVRAPFTGVVSRRYIDPGNLVKADDTTLTTIVSLDPMYVYFDVDERTLLLIRHWMREGKIRGVDEKGMEVKMGLADEEDFPHKGTIDFMDNKLDPGTGTLRLRGVFRNPEPHVLYPGLFVRLRIQIGNKHPAVLVAERALGTDQGQKFVYLVNDENKVEYKSVRLGSLHDGLRVVEDLLPFELTEKSLASLRAAKVPESVLKKLAKIKKGKDDKEQEFRKELGKVLSKDELENYQDKVLIAAQDFELTEKSLVSLRAAKVPESILKKLATIKKGKDVKEQEFRKELGKVLSKDELENYQDKVLIAAQDFEKAKTFKVIVSGLQRVREKTEVEYGQVEKMLDQRPGQKRK